MEKKILLVLSDFERDTLKILLEEEINRNGEEWPDINEACEVILKQL